MRSGREAVLSSDHEGAGARRATLLLLVALGFLAGATGYVFAAAQPSPYLNYQGVLRDPNNVPLDGSFDIRFRFFDAATGGNKILKDFHEAAGTGAVNVTGGLFKVKLGSGVVSDGDGPGTYATLAEMFRDYGTVHMEVVINGEALSPRIEIVSAASALNADHLDGRDSSGFIDTSSSGQTKAGDLTIGGTLAIQGGGPADGLVLTSDAAGNATWQPPPPGTEGPQGPAGPAGPAGPQGPAGGAARPVHTVTTLDNSGIVGLHSSITIGADGLPVISYVDLLNGGVKVARCQNVECTSAAKTTIASGVLPHGTAIVIGSDGLPIISFTDELSRELRIVHCDDPGCASSSQISPLGSIMEEQTSIAIGGDGFPVIAFRGQGNGLGVIKCSDVDCGKGWSYFELPVPSEVTGTSIAIGADGLPVIGYLRSLAPHRADCLNPACTAATITDLSSGNSGSSSTSVAAELPGDALVAHWATDGLVHGVKIDTTLIDSSVGEGCNDGCGVSVAVLPDGARIVSYVMDDEFGVSAGLRVAYCAPGCSALAGDAILNVVDSSLDVGYYSSITIGTDGFPIVSYYDQSNGALKVAHCSNRICLPHVRSR